MNTLPQFSTANSASTNYSDFQRNNNIYRGGNPPANIHAANTQSTVQHAYTLSLYKVLQSQSNAYNLLPQRRDNTRRSNKISLERALSNAHNSNQIDRETLLSFRNTQNLTHSCNIIKLEKYPKTQQNTQKRKKRKIWIQIKNTLNSKTNSLSSVPNSETNKGECYNNQKHCHSGPPRGTPGEQDSFKWKLVFLRFLESKLNKPVTNTKSQRRI